MPDIAPIVVPLPSVAANPTVSNDTLISRVRKLVLDEPYEDFLTASVTGDSTSGSYTSITVNAPTSWAEGDIIEFRDSTYELAKVRVGGANPLNAKRGHNDTTAAAHDSGATILKNPRFPADEINEALTRIGYKSWPWVWAVESTTISPVANTYLYGLPSDVRDLVAVTQDISTSAGNAQVWSYGSPGWPVSVQRNLPYSLSSTGVGLYIPNVYQTSSVLNVYYRTLLTPNNIPDGLVADAMVLGAVTRLLQVRQVARSGIDIRQAEPGLASAYLQDSATFEAEYDDALRKAYLQLLETQGPMPLWRG